MMFINTSTLIHSKIGGTLMGRLIQKPSRRMGDDNTHPNAEDDPWTISPEDQEEPGDEEGINTYRLNSYKDLLIWSKSKTI